MYKSFKIITKCVKSQRSA